MESAKEEIPEIAEQVACIGELMSALSLISRAGSKEEGYEKIDINQVLGKTLRIMGQQLKERNINISVEPCPDPASKQIAGNMSYLVLVFVNLIVNARDAVESSRTPDKIIRIRAYRTNDSRVAIEVQDNGPGISDEIMPRIFEPYFTTKKKNGTGIGLAFSKRIVENHRGTMEIESEPGKGATFRVLLPLNLRRTSFPAAAGRSS